MGRPDCDGGGTGGADGGGGGGGERWPAILASTDEDAETADPEMVHRANAANHCCRCTTVAAVVAAAAAVAVVVAAAAGAVAGNGWRKMRADEPTRASTADGNCRNCH